MTRLVLPGLLLLATACSTRTVQLTRGPQASSSFALQNRQLFQRVPMWYLNPPPRDSSHLVASATALSADMSLALERAELDARNQLTAQLDAKFAGIAVRMQHEMPQGDSAAVADEFTRLYRGTMSQWLRGSRARERHVEPEGSGFRAWVLVEVPVTELSREVVRTARRNAHVGAQIVASATFRELERTVGVTGAERPRP